jgi:hypothetical protein
MWLLHRLPILIKHQQHPQKGVCWLEVRVTAIPQPRSSSSPLPSEYLHRSQQTAATSALPCKLSASTIQAGHQQPQRTRKSERTCNSTERATKEPKRLPHSCTNSMELRTAAETTCGSSPAAHITCTSCFLCVYKTLVPVVCRAYLVGATQKGALSRQPQRNML